MESCSYFDSGICRSCGLLGLPYDAQLTRKHESLVAAFAAAGFGDSVQPLVASDSAFGSRNKAKMAVGGSVSVPLLGFAGPGYQVIDIIACPLHIRPIPEILSRVQALISEFALQPYDINARSGELKYVLVRSSEANAQTMVRFVLRSREQFAAARNSLLKLKSEFPEISVVSINIQPVPQAIIEGDEEIIVSEHDHIVDAFAGKYIAFSPQSFSQVTSNVATKLYKFVGAVVREAKVRILLDLYCGVGAFSLVCSADIEGGIGVELSTQAIGNARRSMILNGISNLEFVAADVSAYIKSYAASADAVIVNPPRRGLSESIIREIKRIRPRLVVYSSCYPDSLLRDLKSIGPDYAIKQIVPFDMFPLTTHVETVVVLERR